MNQKKGARLALKLSLTVVIPIFLITIAGILLSAYKQSDLSEDLVKREISGIARSLRQTYLATDGNEKFVMKGDNLYKGNTMLSGNYKLVDQLKNEQEVEVSLFFGDVREVTTLKDESGKREINTKMSSEVYDTLKKGEEYLVFATKNNDGTYTTLSDAFGRMQIKNDLVTSLNVANNEVEKTSQATDYKVNALGYDVMRSQIENMSLA